MATWLPEIEAAGIEWLHLDVMDGQFVPPITFGAAYAKQLGKKTHIPMEAHLMTFTPEAHFSDFIEAGCTRVIFHQEATVHSHRLLQQLKQEGIQAGIAINPGTSVSVLEPLLEWIDMALIMTVNPGWGGQKLIESTLEKAKTLKSWRPDILVQVDGGVDNLTAAKVSAAGVGISVVGSYLLREQSVTDAVYKIRDAIK